MVRTKKEQVRWNSTKKQDAENERIREVKNLVAEAIAPLAKEMDAVARELLRIVKLTDDLAVNTLRKTPGTCELAKHGCVLPRGHRGPHGDVPSSAESAGGLSGTHYDVGDGFNEAKPAGDAVNHPAHYTRGGIEVIDALEAWGLRFNPANAVKYLARAGHKDPAKEIEDLEKAEFYVRREIDRLKKAGSK